MIDLHTHTFFSDGELLPSELIQRARKKGYGVIGLTDHADAGNYEMILENLLKVQQSVKVYEDIRVLVGIEITHVPPSKIGELARSAREKGAQLVVVHGETLVEPVEAGTNEAAIDAGADILAHPGLLSPSLALQAAQKGVLLEISVRRGHSLTNGYLAKLARETGAKLAFDSDGHSPSDLFSDFNFYRNLALGAGLSVEEFQVHYENLKERVKKIPFF